MKQLVLSLMALVLVAGQPTYRPALAEEAAVKPVAVLTIASYEKLMTDIGFMGNLAGSPDLDKNLEGMIQLFTQGQGFAGLDKKRPIGIALTTDGTQFQPLIVLPVENLKTLLEALAGLVGDAQDAGNGLFELNVFNQKIFVKEKKGWALMGMTPDAINTAPDDPAKFFGGLDKSYDIAARLHVQNVPELYRSLLIDQLRLGIDAGLARQPEEADEAYEMRKKIVQTQMERLSKSINELDQLTLGISLDPMAKEGTLDIDVTAVPDSDLARQLSQMQSGSSDFAGFLVPEAAASLNVTMKISKADNDQLTAGLSGLRDQVMKHLEESTKLSDAAAKKLAKEMAGQAFDAIKATIESGKIDAGATLNVGEKSMALVVGAYVSDPKSLEEALKKFVKLSENEPNFPGLKFDAAQHAGVRFHTTSIAVPESDMISKVMGNKLDVAIGIGEKSVYLALGTDSLKLCQTLIDKSKAASGKQQPPMQLNASLGPILQFASALQGNPAVAEMAKSLAKAGGKDHVFATITPQPSGIRIHVKAEEGVLQLLGDAFKNAQASGALPGIGL